jgi:nucleotide-binding universal stress UspA family protein
VFETIIVGVDAREGGRDALALAAALARTCDGELVAVHAYPYDYFVSRGADSDFESAMHGAAMETLEGELDRAGVLARPIAVPDSSPGRALHLAARRNDGDLIVVGSAHRGPLGRVLAGDATASALHGAPCPVLVAPAGYARHGGELRTIGVAYDGSPEAHAALTLARDVAQTAGARLRVIEVVAMPQLGDPYFAYATDWGELTQARREEAEERVARVVAELGPIATGDVVVGLPARELAFAGNELDLLVTGSRNYGPIRRLVLGSTSARLVHEAPCPVLVATRSAAGEDEEADADAAVAAAEGT